MNSDEWSVRRKGRNVYEYGYFLGPGVGFEGPEVTTSRNAYEYSNFLGR